MNVPDKKIVAGQVETKKEMKYDKEEMKTDLELVKNVLEGEFPVTENGIDSLEEKVNKIEEHVDQKMKKKNPIDKKMFCKEISQIPLEEFQGYHSKVNEKFKYVKKQAKNLLIAENKFSQTQHNRNTIKLYFYDGKDFFLDWYGGHVNKIPCRMIIDTSANVAFIRTGVARDL